LAQIKVFSIGENPRRSGENYLDKWFCVVVRVIYDYF